MNNYLELLITSQDYFMENISYRDAKKELEDILSEIENETVDMDELLEKVKRATTLLNYCQEKLQNSEEELKKILSQGTIEQESGESEETL
jgi:exodeoxyribonuclease VII small subunit